jgi:hypothetical protein
MSDTSTSEPNDVPAGADPPLYEVVSGPMDCAVAEGVRLPRHPNRGMRGVLLVDRPAGLVYLLDADDDAKTFTGRERRPLAGDPTDLVPPRDGSDHVVRAALERDYDVIAAPWAGADLGELPGVSS